MIAEQETAGRYIYAIVNDDERRGLEGGPRLPLDGGADRLRRLPGLRHLGRARGSRWSATSPIARCAPSEKTWRRITPSSSA